MRFSSRPVAALLITLVGLSCATCGKEQAGPTSPTPPPPTAPTPLPPTIARVSINGTPVLSSVGETTQLTATASLSDGSVKDVTADGRWTSSDIRVVTISSTGLMTVVGFGRATVNFLYQNRGAGLTVTATTPGTFVIAGRVREPGVGGIANLVVVETSSGRSATTGIDGQFSLAQLPRPEGHVKVEKEGYEPAEADAIQNTVDLPMQRVIRLMAGETVNPWLAPNDLTYTVAGTRCNDCRLVRVVVSEAGGVHFHLTWGTAARLSLLVDGQVVTSDTRDLVADVPVNAPRELLMYFGAIPPSSVSAHTQFTFESALRKVP